MDALGAAKVKAERRTRPARLPRERRRALRANQPRDCRPRDLIRRARRFASRSG